MDYEIYEDRIFLRKCNKCKNNKCNFCILYNEPIDKAIQVCKVK